MEIFIIPNQQKEILKYHYKCLTIQSKLDLHMYIQCLRIKTSQDFQHSL